MNVLYLIFIAIKCNLAAIVVFTVRLLEVLLRSQDKIRLIQGIVPLHVWQYITVLGTKSRICSFNCEGDGILMTLFTEQKKAFSGSAMSSTVHVSDARKYLCKRPKIQLLCRMKNYYVVLFWNWFFIFHTLLLIFCRIA